MNRFDAWLRTANAGDQYVYRRGTSLSKKNEGKEFSESVFSAREAWERGEVELVTKRLTHPRHPNGCGTFEWIAVRRETKATRKQWISKDGCLVQWVKRRAIADAA